MTDARFIETPLRVSYLRAIFITLICVLASWAVTIAALALKPGHDPAVFSKIIGPAILISTLVPVLVSFPVCIILQRGRIKLARAMQQLESMHGELARRSRIDPLTSLLNREALMNDIEALHKDGKSGAMLMIDIDHFKAVNDTHGHLAGDEALKLVSGAIRSSVRDGDVVGRLGGEEFGAFVVTASQAQALDVAERIRDAVARTKFHPLPGVVQRLTTSVGVAMGHPGDSLSDMLRRADTSLYEAKGAGRNRVMVHAA